MMISAQTRNQLRKQKRKQNLKDGMAKRAITRSELAAEQDLGKLVKAITDHTVIGRGAYNIRKAFNGKYARRKQRNTARSLFDIGGRAVSGDTMGALTGGMKILGMGDYTVNRNTIVENLTNRQVPMMHSGKENVRFRHREYLCDITGTTAFTAQEFYINPGLSETFPYLAQMGALFQEYRFHGLAFEFKSTSAVSLSTGTSTQMGSVMMAAVYKPQASTLQSKVELLAEMWAVDGRPSDDFMLPIECAPQSNDLDVLFVRNTTVPSGEDQRFYDLARVTVATQAVSNNVVGELWVTYDVEFLKPTLNYYDSVRVAVFDLGTTASTSAYLGTAPTTVHDGIGVTLSTTNSSITWTKNTQHYYLITYMIAGTSTVLTTSMNSTLTNLTTYAGYGTKTFKKLVAASTADTQFYDQWVYPTAAGTQCVYQLTSGTLPTSITSGNLYIFEFPFDTTLID